MDKRSLLSEQSSYTISSPLIVSFAELLPTYSYHFGLSPDYLSVALRRSVFRSALCILFTQYPLHLESVPRSATWEGARWRVTDNPTRCDHSRCSLS